MNMSKKGLSPEEIASMTGKELEDVRTILEGKKLVMTGSTMGY